MQIKIKIIPDNGPNETYEFATFPEAIKFIIEREPEDHEYIKVPAVSQVEKVVTPGWSIVPGEVKVPVRSESTETQIPINKKPGFLERIFG